MIKGIGIKKEGEVIEYHDITLADDMVGKGLKKDENGVISVDVDNLVKTTWAELKALRDEAKLNAGSFYRITDYVTTTTQLETKSANHPFDVIVLALNENTLCEDAKAILHEGDTYFADSNLSAWELKYCLDNDKTRFAWADETNGKGVIYRMIDERRNDCPYDFKNILFHNTRLTTNTTSDKYYYTFSYAVTGVLYDGTTEKKVTDCYRNVMGEFCTLGKLLLNRNVFRNTTFAQICSSNTFGSNCSSNTFGQQCYSNTFAYRCTGNTLGNYCSCNTFGPLCESNRFGDGCSHNTFRSSCSSNTFGQAFISNTFGFNNAYNKFGIYCQSNSFGDNCRDNIFGDYLTNRSLGSEQTCIKLNEEFYDDGSGQLVPTKHPDLSTQPSILPYKFMGQYVYEILLPISDIDLSKSQYVVNASNLLEYVKDLHSVAILQSEELLFCRFDASPYPIIPMFVHRNVTISTSEQYGGTAYYNLVVTPDKFATFSGEVVKAYLRIVYTSMPEEGEVYYYGNDNDTISFLSDFSFPDSEQTYILTPDGNRYQFTYISSKGIEANVPRHYLEVGEIQFCIPGYNISKITDGFGTYVTLKNPNFISSDEFKPFIGSSGIRFYKS